MKILAIETATEACSAALLYDNEVVEKYKIAPRQHNELILPMCDEVLAESGVNRNELDAIAFGCGPGAFTGVRIAAGVTQGIAMALDLPVIPVSTLANLAHQEFVKEPDAAMVLAAIDARMEEIYWALYKKDPLFLSVLVGTEKVQAPNALDVELPPNCSGAGSGWKTYNYLLQEKTLIKSDKIDADLLPRAEVTALLGKVKFLREEIVSAEHAFPVYLRDKVVHQKR